jgi:dephospho-CoA kinase
VRDRWQAQREHCISSGRHLLADIPLLFETGAEPLFDRVVVVAASAGTQMTRLASRSLTPAEAEAMLASQAPIVQKIRQASIVVWNDGDQTSLLRQASLAAELLFAS